MTIYHTDPDPVQSQNHVIDPKVVNEIFSDLSADLYMSVLKHVPLNFMQVKEFSQNALAELKKVDSAVKHDRPHHVIHILSGLVSAGLVQTESYEVREAPYSRLVGSVLKYRLTDNGKEMLK